MFPAHIREKGSEKIIQTAEEHCRKSAEYAGECLSSVGLEQTAKLCGLVHDLGKFKKEFADYLKDDNAVPRSVNHTFAGFRFLMERYHGDKATSFEDLTAELLALAVGAHHGLFDCVNEHGKSEILHRMTKPNIHYEESKQGFLEECASRNELDESFAKAHAELSPIYEKLADLTQDAEESSFYLGLLARLLLSAVIEGDRRDTAEFMNDIKYPSYPTELKDMQEFWEPYLAHMEEELKKFGKDTSIAKARGEISDRCRNFAENEGGIYRLNVPTGAGKTLSSLRYALAHAQKWGKRRIIFTSPLLSILEQNAEVIREYVGDNGIILEHHSNVLQTEENEELDLRELAVENWNSPIIITTMVQLLNTLFLGKTTAIRRFQALCSSIIVIDEVQTVPLKMLSLFNLAMNFLSEVCGATVLLCSATQPCLEKTTHPLTCCKGDVIPYDKALWEPFKRTVITDAGGKTLEEIEEFALDCLEEVQSLLIVCNKKDEAEQLFHKLKDHADVSCHLSASMCIAHRRKVLEQLAKALENGKKCLCVATQVIEAGVDISFERVIRLSAGMDSVIQAAGRCNRHGEQEEPVPVYVVFAKNENLQKLQEIEKGRDATQTLLNKYGENPNDFDCNLSSDKAIDFYYHELYNQLSVDYQDFCICIPKNKDDESDEKKIISLFKLLSVCSKHSHENTEYGDKYIMTQAFRTAGKLFRVFDNNTIDVVVPYGEGERLIEELAGEQYPQPWFLSNWLKRVKPYTVAVYSWQLEKLGNSVTEYSGILVLSSGSYDKDTGLILGSGELPLLET